MSRQAGPTTEILLKRVREYGGLATDTDYAISILSRCQRIANAGFGFVKTSGTLTVPKQKLIYTYRSEFASAIDITSVKVGTRRLLRVDTLSDLAALDIDWWRKIDGTRLEAFCQLGRSLLILYPGLASASSATVTYTKLTTAATSFSGNYNDDLELPDEQLDFALMLAEALLLLSSRRNLEASKRLSDLTEAVTQQLNLRSTL